MFHPVCLASFLFFSFLFFTLEARGTFFVRSDFFVSFVCVHVVYRAVYFWLFSFLFLFWGPMVFFCLYIDVFADTVTCVPAACGNGSGSGNGDGGRYMN